MTHLLRKAWTHCPPLMAVCYLMLAAFIASVAGIFLDPRLITGVPAWLKPAKFAISTSIFSGTVAWLFGFISVWPGLRRALGWTLAVALVLEVAIIDIQAARGTTSHFNIATPVDQLGYAVMGVTIGVLWVALIGVLMLLLRQPFQNRAWAWALRGGMLITVLGAGLGGVMTAPTHEQKEARRLHQSVTLNGGHTVGAPDGGPGLPVAGWSTRHGDMRIPHFLGLHAIQIVPLLGWLLRKRRRAFELTVTAGASYFALIAILAWQALRGQPLLVPDAATAGAFAMWAAATAGAAFFLNLGRATPMTQTSAVTSAHGRDWPGRLLRSRVQS